MTDNFWNGKRVIVTGGAGFLGSFVIQKLKEHGATDIVIPTIQKYNLIDRDDIRRMYKEELSGVEPKNVVVIHLAAHVGERRYLSRHLCWLVLGA